MFKKNALNQSVAPKQSITEILFYFLLAALVILLFLGAPSDGDFYWSDSLGMHLTVFLLKTC